MSDPTVEKLQQDLQKHRELLSAANDEIESLRDQIGQCATTILETVMLEDSQGEEIDFLRARVTELETILVRSEEQSKAAEQVIAQMRGAMDRMQETIKRVAGEARVTATATDLTARLQELEDVIDTAPMPDDLERLIGPD